MRTWSVVRWTLVFCVTAAVGFTGWTATLLFLINVGSFDEQFIVLFCAAPVILFILAVDFVAARERGGYWRWLVVRAVGTFMAGSATGMLLRLYLAPGDQFDYRPHDVTTYSWWLLCAGLAVLAAQPLLALVRRLVVAVVGAPRRYSSEPDERPQTAESDRRSDTDRTNPRGVFFARPPRWPGPAPVKFIAGALTLALVAGAGFVLFERARWHIHLTTSSSVPPVAAAGTIGDQEMIAVPYEVYNRAWLVDDYRVAALDATTGELVWDQRLYRADTPKPEPEAILFDERGLFLRSEDPSSKEEEWFVLDARTGSVKTGAVPPDVTDHAAWLYEHVPDEGIDYEFGEDAEIVTVPRYGESRLVNPMTGEPAGETAGFRLDRFCCEGGPRLELHVDDELIDSLPAAPYSRAVIAETESGTVVIYGDADEGKGGLIFADADGFTTSVVGDRGWFPWF